MRRDLPQPLHQIVQSGAIALDREPLSTWTHRDVETILRDVDTDDDEFHGDPSLSNRASHRAAQATVRVRWNDRRGTTLSHGLQGPRALRTPACHRDPKSIRVATMRVTRAQQLAAQPRSEERRVGNAATAQ